MSTKSRHILQAIEGVASLIIKSKKDDSLDVRCAVGAIKLLASYHLKHGDKD